MSNDDISKLSRIDAAQIHRLAHRLSELDLLDLNDDPDEEVGIAFVNNARTGEIVTAVDVGESMYWEQGTQLIEQKEVPGGIKYRPIGPDGEPGEWDDAPPPPSRSQTNWGPEQTGPRKTARLQKASSA